jgi:hypothetical protein
VDSRNHNQGNSTVPGPPLHDGNGVQNQLPTPTNRMHSWIPCPCRRECQEHSQEHRRGQSHSGRKSSSWVLTVTVPNHFRSTITIPSLQNCTSMAGFTISRMEKSAISMCQSVPPESRYHLLLGRSFRERLKADRPRHRVMAQRYQHLLIYSFCAT